MSGAASPPRRAAPADLAMVRAITEAAYAEYEPVLGAPPMPVVENYAPRIARGEVWLLPGAGQPAALAVLEQHPDHMMIWSLAVLPDRQGQGLGRALLRFAEDRARAAGLPELRLFTNALMARNLRLYARAGFRETGRGPHPRRPEFTVVDMARRLTG